MATQRRKHFLREWREHRGLSLETVAHEIGGSHPNLSKIERGQLPYKEDLLESLALLYGCAPVELLIRDPRAPIDIFSLMGRATPEQRDQIGRVAEAMISFRDTSST